MDQLIGLREKLEEHPIFHRKIWLVSGEEFPFLVNPLNHGSLFTEIHLFPDFLRSSISPSQMIREYIVDNSQLQASTPGTAAGCEPL